VAKLDTYRFNKRSFERQNLDLDPKSALEDYSGLIIIYFSRPRLARCRHRFD